MSTNFYNKKYPVIKSTNVWGTNTTPTTIHEFEEVVIDGGGVEHLTNETVSSRGGMANYIQAGLYKTVTLTLKKAFEFNRSIDLWALMSILGSYAGTDLLGVVTHVGTQKKILESSEIEDLLFSTAHTEGTEAKYIPSVFFNEVVLEYADGRLKISAKGDGSHYLIGDGTMYTAIAGLPLETTDRGGYATFAGLDFKMNDTKDLTGDTESALGSSDVMKISKLKITFTRDAKALPPNSGDSFPAQPTDMSGLKIKLEIEENTKTAKGALWSAKHDLAKSQKAKLVFTGKAIPGETGNYSLDIDFPRLEIKEKPKYDQKTPTPVTATFDAVEAIAAPSGFASTLTTCTVVNTIPVLTGFPV